MAPLNLMELPIELVLNIVAYALNSDEAVNLGPETMQQDILRIKRQLLRPLQCCSKLYDIAKSDFERGNLTYRLHMELITVRKIAAEEQRDIVTLDAKNSIQLAGGSVPANVELSFNGEHKFTPIETDARWVKHLELIMPMDSRSAQTLFRSAAEAEQQTRDIFAYIRQAFPSLKMLTVRITTYRIGSGDVAIWDLVSSTHFYASDRRDVIAQKIFDRIRNTLLALHEYHPPKLKIKQVILFQKAERDWREWRNGPLGKPLLDTRSPDLSGSGGLDGLVWQMMDLPSCRLRF